MLYPAQAAWRAEMRALLASFGGRVVDHGRVGQPALLRAKARCQLLYYITTFPEIDCIAAREAAMLGCVPLTSTYGVFGDDAKDYCVRVPGDPANPETQRAAAQRAVALLEAYVDGGAAAMPSVDTPTLRAETWARIAARWEAEVLPPAAADDNNAAAPAERDGRKEERNGQDSGATSQL